MSGDALGQSGNINAQQLTQAIANLVMTSADSRYQTVIRGVGTRGVTQSQESNVALYADGVRQLDQATGDWDVAARGPEVRGLWIPVELRHRAKSDWAEIDPSSGAWCTHGPSRTIPAMESVR